MSASVEARFVSLSNRYLSIERDINKLRQILQQSTNLLDDVLSVAGGKVRYHDPSDIKELQPCLQDTPEVAALRKWCLTHQLYSARFRWVPSDYYSHSLQWRRDILGAASIQHLCKTIVLENTHCVNSDCSIRENSRYYLVVYQYTERFDAELLMLYVKDMNKGLGRKKFNFRLASSDVALQLTGFSHGAVAPFGTSVDIPVILSNKIVTLTPSVFWIGGGHVDCKVCVDVRDFVNVIKPMVADITVKRSDDELEGLIE